VQADPVASLARGLPIARTPAAGWKVCRMKTKAALMGSACNSSDRCRKPERIAAGQAAQWARPASQGGSQHRDQLNRGLSLLCSSACATPQEPLVGGEGCRPTAGPWHPAPGPGAERGLKGRPAFGADHISKLASLFMDSRSPRQMPGRIAAACDVPPWPIPTAAQAASIWGTGLALVGRSGGAWSSWAG